MATVHPPGIYPEVFSPPELKPGNGSLNARDISCPIPQNAPQKDTAAEANEKAVRVLREAGKLVEKDQGPINIDREITARPSGASQEITGDAKNQTNNPDSIITDVFLDLFQMVAPPTPEPTPVIVNPQESVITDTFLDLFAKMADTAPEGMSDRLEDVSVEEQQHVDSTSKNLANASTEEIKETAAGIDSSICATSATNETFGKSVTSPFGRAVEVNNHAIFITPTLTIVGDVPSSAEKGSEDQEVNSILDAALNSPSIPDQDKEIIKSCREQGKVCHLDPESTKAAHKESILNATRMVEEARTPGGENKVELLEKLQTADKGEQRKLLTEFAQIAQSEINDKNTPQNKRLALVKTAESLPEALGFGPDPKLQPKLEKFDFGEAGKLGKTPTGILFAYEPVDVSKLREVIQQSPLSQEQKSWLLDKLEKGQIEIPTKADMREIEQLKQATGSKQSESVEETRTPESGKEIQSDDVINADMEKKKAAWLEGLNKIEPEINDENTSPNRRLALVEVGESFPEELGLGSDPKLKPKIEKFDFGEAGKLGKTSRGILFAYGPVDIAKLIEAIEISSLSQEKKSWLLDKIARGQIELHTEADMKEIEKLKKEVRLELLTFMKAWIEKHREEKKIERKKGPEVHTAASITKTTKSQKIYIDMVAEEILNELKQHKHSRNKGQEELAIEEYWLRRKAEFKEEIELLLEQTKLTAKYVIKEYIKFLLKHGDYTEEELKKEVLTWLLTKKESLP